MIKAVIFDVDGLLIDSEPFWERAYVDVFARRGFRITKDDVKARAGGLTAKIIEDWRQHFGWDKALNSSIQNEVEAEVQKGIEQDGQPLPGVLPILDLLKRRKVPMAVASAAAPEVLRTNLTRLGITDFFQVVHSAVHDKRGKPHPDVFLRTAEALGMTPQSCLVFEDSLNGVRAAKAAGMFCIAVPHAPYDLQAFAVADKVLPSLEAVSWEMIESL